MALLEQVVTGGAVLTQDSTEPIEWWPRCIVKASEITWTIYGGGHPDFVNLLDHGQDQVVERLNAFIERVEETRLDDGIQAPVSQVAGNFC